jgi:hypothetical protein
LADSGEEYTRYLRVMTAPEIRLLNTIISSATKSFGMTDFLSIDYELTMANWGLKFSHRFAHPIPRILLDKNQGPALVPAPAGAAAALAETVTVPAAYILFFIQLWGLPAGSRPP